MPALRTVSRRFSAKVSHIEVTYLLTHPRLIVDSPFVSLGLQVMYMGVVAAPIPEKNFDGKIYFKRVANEVTAQKAVFTEDFADEVYMNQQIRDTWRSCCWANMTSAQMIEAIDNEYQVSVDRLDKLVHRYCTLTGSSGKRKWNTLSPNEGIAGKRIRVHENGQFKTRDLNLCDLQLRVARQAGDTYHKDVNCDSKFMMVEMPLIGAAMRQAYHWVPQDIPLYLCMDNAGGHGTKDCIDTYVQALKDEFNVIVIHQVPRSPETNILDLGVWCSLQSAVEKKHRGKQTKVETLARTIEATWDAFDSQVFANVYGRWKKVLDLIIADHGDNSLVDSHRGELFVPLVMPQFGVVNYDSDDEQAGEEDEDVGDD
jgi:hypothetical protein